MRTVSVAETQIRWERRHQQSYHKEAGSRSGDADNEKSDSHPQSDGGHP